MPLLDDIRNKCDEIERQVTFIKTLERTARNPNWSSVDPGYTNMKAIANTAIDALIILAQELKALIIA